MGLFAWFRRWNAPEARQRRKRHRRDAWNEAGREADEMRGRSGPSAATIYRRMLGPDNGPDDEGVGLK